MKDFKRYLCDTIPCVDHRNIKIADKLSIKLLGKVVILTFLDRELSHHEMSYSLSISPTIPFSGYNSDIAKFY
jgi:hypothetical protein